MTERESLILRHYVLSLGREAAAWFKQEAEHEDARGHLDLLAQRCGVRGQANLDAGRRLERILNLIAEGSLDKAEREAKL